MLKQLVAFGAIGVVAGNLPVPRKSRMHQVLQDLPVNVVEYFATRIDTGSWQAMSERYLKRVAAALLLVVMAGGSVQAQKSGGVLRIYHRDSPASMSIHEEGTNSVAIPMMAVFNNLMLYD